MGILFIRGYELNCSLQYGHFFASTGIFIAQVGQVFSVGSASGSGSLILLYALININTTKPKITNEITSFIKRPYLIAGAPAFSSAYRLG
jgi:hypothetical protein